MSGYQGPGQTPTDGQDFSQRFYQTFSQTPSDSFGHWQGNHETFNQGPYDRPNQGFFAEGLPQSPPQTFSQSLDENPNQSTIQGFIQGSPPTFSQIPAQTIIQSYTQSLPRAFSQSPSQRTIGSPSPPPSRSPTEFRLPDSRTISYALDVPQNPLAPERFLIVLANPLCAPLTIWDHVVPSLTAQGFIVFRYDPPGHGYSSLPIIEGSTTFRQIAEDVYAVLESICSSEHGTTAPKWSIHGWVGLSMGAATGVTFAAMYPSRIKRLVVGGTTVCSFAALGYDIAKDPVKSWVNSARRPGGMDLVIENTLDWWVGRKWRVKNPGEYGRLMELMKAGVTPAGFEACCVAMMDPFWDLRGEMSVQAGRNVERVLMIVGENDRVTEGDMQRLRVEMDKGLKEHGKEPGGVIFRGIRGTGHMPFVDRFTNFIYELDKFLRLGTGLPPNEWNPWSGE